MISNIRQHGTRRSVRATLLLQGVLAAAILQGCERGGSGTEAGIPALVEKMANAPILADGRIHARSAGRFSIEPDTAFCTFRPGYSLDSEQLDAALRQLGQNPIRDGAYRTHQAGVSKQCIPNRSVFIKATQTANRQGRPYKLTFAVWQGDAAWIGAIERPNGVRSEYESARPFRDGMPPLTPMARDNRDREDADHRAKLSIDRDMVDLSQAVLNRIVKDTG